MTFFKKQLHLSINQKTISHLPVGIEKPGYDRTKVSSGIVHFGLGNFYRSHLAAYLNRLLVVPGHETWGITGVEIIENPENKQKTENYTKQDNLYTLTQFKEDGTHKTALIGSLCDHLYAPENPEKVLEVLSRPETKIVSLTITEGGYNIDAGTGEFCLNHPDIVHDLKNPQRPKTVFGFVVEALKRRHAAGIAPFTVMSCDNVLHNGKTAFKAFTSFAEARDAALAKWIKESVAFPNSMVDRITPTLSEQRKADINHLNKVHDLLPVLSEEFIQWVLEDNFSNGRPDFAKVGVQLIAGGAIAGGLSENGGNAERNGAVAPIEAFEQAKLRILNEAHLVFGLSGMIENIAFIDKAAGHKALRDFVETLLKEDVLPTLKAPKGIDLSHYADQVLARFGNAALEDTCARIAGDSVSKALVFWSETLMNALSGKTEETRAVFMCAILLEYLRGRRGNGEAYTLYEPALSEDQIELAKNAPESEGFSLPCFDRVRGYLTGAFQAKVGSCRGMIRNSGIATALFTPY
ncbi:polyol:nadp oxidoreductase [Lasius niger]|uniref:mannitol 2-dehydrogenase n=1 Tax=Lasius niger TaxID=67767 RepID=A0A0J7N1W7_LASNI|nr:polyol:nadp oxidoreductase [Lasius niger]